MTDATPTIAHDQTLLLTFFYRYMRPLVEAGHVYIYFTRCLKGKARKKEGYAWMDGEATELRKRRGYHQR